MHMLRLHQIIKITLPCVTLPWLLVLTSCAIHQHTVIPPPPPEPAIAPPSLPAVNAEYRLGFGDVIDVKFFNNNQFNETLTVRPDGRISMQKVGDIYVAGMTPMELGRRITEIYAKIIKDPEVTVIVRNFGGYQVYVLGEVKSPGAFPLQRSLTVLQSLALAGGHKETAMLKSILLLRRQQDGKIDVQRLDLSQNSAAAIQKNDLFLEASDIIYVPKTFIANVNTFLDQAFSGIIPPLDIYLRAAWWSRW